MVSPREAVTEAGERPVSGLPARARARIAEVLDVPVEVLFREKGDTRLRREGVQRQLDAALTGRRSRLADDVERSGTEPSGTRRSGAGRAPRAPGR